MRSQAPPKPPQRNFPILPPPPAPVRKGPRSKFPPSEVPTGKRHPKVSDFYQLGQLYEELRPEYQHALMGIAHQLLRLQNESLSLASQPTIVAGNGPHTKDKIITDSDGVPTIEIVDERDPSHHKQKR